MTDAQFLCIEHVSKRFGGVVALDDVSLEIAAGEFHAVVGENGAGKSTLMKILSGVLTDYEGTIRLRGERTVFEGTRDAEASGVSIIHQELNLVEELTAAANIFLGREKRNRFRLIDDRAMEREALGLFARLECDIRPNVPVRELRVGDQQLVEIAKALSMDTEILIMDEPTSALTEAEVERLFRVIERLRDRGVTILYITHKLDEVFRLSNRITVLRDGRIVATLNREETSRREITHLMVGREIEAVHRRGAIEPGSVNPDATPQAALLQVENLSLPWTGHARQWRLKDIRFELRRGEVLGIAGLMGAGRTELLECLFGTSPEPPTGKILIDGIPRYFDHPAQAMKNGMALVTEDRKRLGLFDHMTVRDNITICTLAESTIGGIVSPWRERAAAEKSIELFSIKTAVIDAPISSLSGGNQQKCVIARWLLMQPKILLLDDPTRGIDVGAKAEIYHIIDDLCRRGLGVIVTSSELPELLMLCDRILVLCEGRLTRELSREEFSEQAIMEAAMMRVTG